MVGGADPVGSTGGRTVRGGALPLEVTTRRSPGTGAGGDSGAAGASGTRAAAGVASAGRTPVGGVTAVLAAGAAGAVAAGASGEAVVAGAAGRAGLGAGAAALAGAGAAAGGGAGCALAEAGAGSSAGGSLPSRFSRSASFRTRYACASSMLEEVARTPIPRLLQRSRHWLLEIPNSLAKSYTRIFFATALPRGAALSACGPTAKHRGPPAPARRSDRLRRLRGRPCGTLGAIVPGRWRGAGSRRRRRRPRPPGRAAPDRPAAARPRRRTSRAHRPDGRGGNRCRCGASRRPAPL